MKRVKRSRSILHKQASIATGWDVLIMAAKAELTRIKDRSLHLTEAIETFQKKKAAGESCPESH